MKMTRNEYAQLKAEMDKIFEEKDVAQIKVDVDCFDGRGFIIECAPAEEPRPAVTH